MTRTTTNIRVLAIAVALLCAIGFMPLLADSMQSHAAAKVKVDKTKVTVQVGSSAKVTAKGLKAKQLKKVTWKSSKTTVANITKAKGKAIDIQGISPGTATITAKYGKKTAKVKVTVKAAPTPEPVEPTANTTVNPDKYVKEGDISVTGYYQGDATVYALLYQESAEVAALQMQAFSLAKIRIDEKAEAKGGYDKLAIVTDIDSTIADDTTYIAGAVLDAAGRMGVEYFGDMLEPWVNDDWCGYYEAVATEGDTVIPGAKEFVDYTYEKGVDWYYITNRPYYELDLTVKQLQHQGFLEKAPDTNKDGTPDLVEAYAFLKDDPDGADGTFNTYQDYYYYGDPVLGAKDADGWMSDFTKATYTNALNNTGKVEMTIQSFSVKDDYHVQVQGTDFDSDKSWRRWNADNAAAKDGREVVMWMGDSINDMVSDYESKIGDEGYAALYNGSKKWTEEKDGKTVKHSTDFTRKQFNDTRTANASSDFWKDHWGDDFIVLPNATYGDWYKATWAKGKDPEEKYDSGTQLGQQSYIYDQIWAHSYKNKDKFDTWYEGPSPVTNDVQ